MATVTEPNKWAKVGIAAIKYVVVPALFLLIGYYVVGPRIGQSAVTKTEAANRKQSLDETSGSGGSTEMFQKDPNPPAPKLRPQVIVEGRQEPQRRTEEPEPTPTDEEQAEAERRAEEHTEVTVEEVPVAPPIDEAGSGGAAGVEAPPIEQPLGEDPPRKPNEEPPTPEEQPDEEPEPEPEPAPDAG